MAIHAREPLHVRRFARVAAFTAVATFALGAFAPAPASACGHGGGGYGLEGLAYVVGVAAITVVTVDVGFVAHDVYEATQHNRVGKTFAIVETIIAIPQLLIFYSLSRERSLETPAVLFGLVPTGMFIHGLATLATPEHDTTGSSSSPLVMTHEGAALTAVGHF